MLKASEPIGHKVMERLLIQEELGIAAQFRKLGLLVMLIKLKTRAAS